MQVLPNPCPSMFIRGSTAVFRIRIRKQARPRPRSLSLEVPEGREKTQDSWHRTVGTKWARKDGGINARPHPGPLPPGGGATRSGLAQVGATCFPRHQEF